MKPKPLITFHLVLLVHQTQLMIVLQSFVFPQPLASLPLLLASPSHNSSFSLGPRFTSFESIYASFDPPSASFESPFAPFDSPSISNFHGVLLHMI